MRTDEVFQNNGTSLSAKDLQGKRVTVQIAGYSVKKFDDGSKPILTFEGKEKTLVLNKTNAYMIGALLGTDEMDEWVGQRITLKPDKTLFEGKMVDCIRIAEGLPQPPAKPKPAPKPQPMTSDEDTFPSDSSDIPF